MGTSTGKAGGPVGASEGTVIAERQAKGGGWVRVLVGDLTEQRVDAIVNAANKHLAHGGGVAAAIVRKGGRVIQDQSNAYTRAHGSVPVGGVAVTSAGALSARYVIHAVGPRWGEGEEPRKLYSAVSAALLKARELGLASVALTAISTGIFGYPVDKAAKTILDAVFSILGALPDGPVREVRVVIWEADKAEVFAHALHAQAV